MKGGVIYKKLQCTCVTLRRGVTGYFLLLKYADFNGQDEYPQYLGPDGYLPLPITRLTNRSHYRRYVSCDRCLGLGSGS